ncbi:uncharacterized protein LOC127411191 isoform X2 [Myxocyprinus asiaticus]|uniref:uncharacterized protein LOC127411191 isoform X2 n=1 Tax=Myxocyprinus asiaticus TaxID=70543 RepID=UPI00222367C2|nr:uncharacterized protein LOC127411191 isoform X2 [Myxocyprinus asiaticus]
MKKGCCPRDEKRSSSLSGNNGGAHALAHEHLPPPATNHGKLSARQERAEQELMQLRLEAAAHIPIPEPRARASQLITKLTEHDDVEAYLQTFEVIAEREGWDWSEWVRTLAPFLMGEVQRAYYALSPASVDDYKELKNEILAWVGLSLVCAAQRFHKWVYDAQVPAHVIASQLSRLACLWLLSGQPTPVQVAERVVVDKFLLSLPRMQQRAVGMRNPETLAALVEAVELAEATQALGGRERAVTYFRKTHQERRPLEGTSQPITKGGAFGREQREDDRLRNCWSQVRIVNGKAGGGETPLGGATYQDGDRARVGPLASHDRALRN